MRTFSRRSLLDVGPINQRKLISNAALRAPSTISPPRGVRKKWGGSLSKLRFFFPVFFYFLCIIFWKITQGNPPLHLPKIKLIFEFVSVFRLVFLVLRPRGLEKRKKKNKKTQKTKTTRPFLKEGNPPLHQKGG